MRRYGRVVLGGTFDHLHAGHEALLSTAFRAGRRVAIGLTTERFLARHPKPRGGAIASEARRRRALAAWLRGRYAPERWRIVPIDDRFGGSVEEGVDALVVSADTLAGGRAVNRERLRRGLGPVPLLVVPLVLSADLDPLSSRRIRAGDVDRDGRLRGPVRIGLAVADPGDRPAAARAIRRVFPRAQLDAAPVLPRGPIAPGRLRRLARRARGSRTLGVAVGPRRSGRWPVVVEGPHRGLGDQWIRGAVAPDLEAGLARLLDPRRRPRLAPRSSRRPHASERPS